MDTIGFGCIECAGDVTLRPTNISPTGCEYENDQENGYGHYFGTCPMCGTIYHLERMGRAEEEDTTERHEELSYYR